jgi:1-acyl-sn-glycerol-3-phosphate acyltransferase
MFRLIHLLIFRFNGWTIVGTFPPYIKKFVIAVAPHTSNWDFTIGLSARSILRLYHSRFIGKSQLFKPPIGWFFRWLGGIPVDRKKSQDMVQQVAQHFKSADEFVLAIAPEGTRKKVDRLKTGFYYIAKAAGVPIFPVGFDFAKKQVVISEPVFPGDNPEVDLEKIMSFYRGITGKNPELGLQ